MLLLVILSSILLISTLGKVVLAVVGEYGSFFFVMLDNISSITLVPWLLVFVLYLRMEHTLTSDV